MKPRSIILAAALAFLALAPLAANAQWRATAWSMDLQNDTDMCIHLTAGQEGNTVIDQADVWPHRGQHFDDNHLELIVHARIYEKPDCTGKFIQDIKADVMTLRNVLTVYKNGNTYAMRREKHL